MVLSSSQTLRPTPVALSKTILVGTPPTYSKICLSAWHTHSAFSEGKTWANPMLENGKESTKKLILRLAPTMAKSASPKSACASPGLQTRSR